MTVKYESKLANLNINQSKNASNVQNNFYIPSYVNDLEWVDDNTFKSSEYNIDFSKIAGTASDAIYGNYIDENKIIKKAFTGTLYYVARNDGTLMVEDSNKVPIGFILAPTSENENYNTSFGMSDEEVKELLPNFDKFPSDVRNKIMDSDYYKEHKEEILANKENKDAEEIKTPDEKEVDKNIEIANIDEENSKVNYANEFETEKSKDDTNTSVVSGTAVSYQSEVANITTSQEEATGTVTTTAADSIVSDDTLVSDLVNKQLTVAEQETTTAGVSGLNITYSSQRDKDTLNSRNIEDTTYAAKSYTLTDEEYRMLVAVVYSEASENSDFIVSDSLAVTSSILNRLENPVWNPTGSTSVIDIIQAKGQYDGIHRSKYKNAMNDMSVVNPVMINCINRVLNGERNTHYCSFCGDGEKTSFSGRTN